MHLTIIDNNDYIASIRAGERSTLHSFHNPLEDSRHKARIDGTSYHAINKDKFTTPSKRNLLTVSYGNFKFLPSKFVHFRDIFSLYIGLDNKMNFSKLTGTPRLLFVTIVRPSSLSNGLAIGNARLTKLRKNLIVVFQSPLEGAQMELSLTIYNDLSQFLALLHNPSRIFLHHSVECFAHFLSIGTIYRLYSPHKLGCGIFYSRILPTAILFV